MMWGDQPLLVEVGLFLRVTSDRSGKGLSLCQEGFSSQKEW